MRETDIKCWKSCLTKEELIEVITIRSFLKLQLLELKYQMKGEYTCFVWDGDQNEIREESNY
jgi:hypothetical protein